MTGSYNTSKFLPTERSIACRAIVTLLTELLLLSTFGSPAVFAQVNVNVNAAHVVAVLPSTGIGLHTSVYANQWGNAALPGRIAEAGVGLLRYPGGSYSDIYHWSNHTATGGYSANQSDFGHFAQVLNQAGTQGMVTVDYGSSHQSAMGGQPKEAAAWVAYANGDASLYGTPNDVSIGVDAEGNDWQTVGYWAHLRSLTAAQNPDNQYDFLAIGRSQPVGIKYWEIGNEINGNGYYSDINANYNWENDLHAATGAARGNNASLSPTAYGNNFNAFAAAMKAVDPTIKVGAVLTGVGGVGDVADSARNWDRNVLQIAGANMDFGIMHYYPNTNNNATTLLNATDDLPAWFQSERDRMNNYVSAGAAKRIELHMTEFGYFGTMSNPVVDGVYAANTYATALADGVKSADWLEMSKTSFVGDTAALTPGPAFYGIQVFSHIAETGADFVDTTSSDGNIEVHSTRLADGRIGMLIANLNPSGSSSVNINIAGLSLAQSGTMWLYGVGQTTPLMTSLTTGLGTSFALSVPFQSILAVVIDAVPGLPGDFDQNGVVDLADYVLWRSGFGASYTQSDYDAWRTHFGQTVAAGASANNKVPEPQLSFAGLITMASICVYRRVGCRSPGFRRRDIAL
ncbi:MAG TPA: hypothetical protein VH107_12015 [Lacipirellulaceae bacterium]|nr:hypothetical protein [Lacipirellulaceae bacterium]